MTGGERLADGTTSKFLSGSELISSRRGRGRTEGLEDRISGGGRGWTTGNVDEFGTGWMRDGSFGGRGGA